VIESRIRRHRGAVSGQCSADRVLCRAVISRRRRPWWRVQRSCRHPGALVSL